MGRGGDATNTGALSGPPVEQKQPAVRKKSGEEMMEAPIVHVDESFWVLVVLYLCKVHLSMLRASCYTNK